MAFRAERESRLETTKIALPPAADVSLGREAGDLRAPFLTLLVVLVVGLAAASGALELADGPLYDLAIRLRAAATTRPPEVVLLAVPEDADDAGPSTWANLLARLALMKPRVVVFAFPAGDLGSRGEWLFGRRLVTGADDTDLRLEGVLGDAPVGRFAGVVALAPASLGVHRWHLPGVEIDGRWVESLEWAVARRLGAAGVDSGRRSRFPIAFRGGPGSLPTVSLERALAGGLIPDLVKGRAVLVGRVGADATEGILTPTTSGLRRMTPLELHGQVLDGLLAGRRLRSAGVGVTLLLLLIVGSGSFLLYQRLSIRLTWRLTLALLALYPLAAMSLLVAVGWWVPPTSLVLAQGVLFSLFTWRKLSISSQAARHLLLEASSQLRQRLWPAHFYLTEEPWKQIALMTYQALDLERVIFLEKLEEEERLREVEAVRCSLEDIQERRRDIRRTPYTTALELAGPLRNDTFLRGAVDGEEQYLVPLLFGGRLHGFWAFGARSEVVTMTPRFLSVVEEISAELAEMLYHRHQARREMRPRGLLQRLSRERQEESYRALSQVFRFLETRIRRVESMVAGMSTAAVLYDLFGHVLEISGKMREILQNEGLATYSLTGVDLVVALTGFDLAGARAALRRAILERETVRLPARLRTRGTPTVLVLRPLVEAGPETATGDPAPFGLSGIVLELVEEQAQPNVVRRPFETVSVESRAEAS